MPTAQVITKDTMVCTGSGITTTLALKPIRQGLFLHALGFYIMYLHEFKAWVPLNAKQYKDIILEGARYYLANNSDVKIYKVKRNAILAMLATI